MATNNLYKIEFKIDRLRRRSLNRLSNLESPFTLKSKKQNFYENKNQSQMCIKGDEWCEE